jgi:DNA-binding NtrC family response regulator
MRVLLVDDDLKLGRSLTRILSRHHEVEYRSSVAEARALLETGESFDVVISDVMMPEETGPDFHRWVHRVYTRVPFRWIFMTGGYGETERLYLEASGEEVVIKPDVERLLELVRTA